MIAELRQEDRRNGTDFTFRDRVRRGLAGEPCYVGKNLSVEFDGDDVILHGEVQSWYRKQVIQETLLRIAGIGRIRNELTVATDDRIPQVTKKPR